MRRVLPFALIGVFLAAASICGAADIIVTRPIGPGVTYTSVRRPEGPWEIRVLRINRDETLIHLQGANGDGTVRGVERLSGIIARENETDDYVIAAANADFFVMAGNAAAGTLCGMAVCNGELIMTARNRTGFALMADGTARIGSFDTQVSLKTPYGSIPRIGLNQKPSKDIAVANTRSWGWPAEAGDAIVRMDGLPLTPNGKWQGAVLEIVEEGQTRAIGKRDVLLRADGYAQTVVGKLKPGDPITIQTQTPELKGPVQFAVGGGPELIKGGKIVPADSARAPRHPRTAIGYNKGEIILVTVDGRQRGWSVGMRMYELAKLMEELGCTDAVNLDGGGSTTAWVRGETVNRPSDGGQRRIANAVLVRSTAPRGPFAKMTVLPGAVVALPGARVPLTVYPTDNWYNPVTPDLSKLQVFGVAEEEPVEATVADRALVIGEKIGEGQVRVSHPEADTASADISLRVLASCPKLEITPPEALLMAGETVEFSVRGLDEDGGHVWLPEDRIEWTLEGDAVEAGEPGVFTAQQPGATATVRVAVGEGTAVATIRVASEVPFEDFEAAPNVRFAKYPDDDKVSGSVSVLKGDAGQGASYCRLKFDLGETSGTRAAYIRLDREMGSTLKLSLLARGASSRPAWLRAAVVDGDGTRELVTFASKVDWSEKWRRLEASVPAGLKPPLVWQSVYVVEMAGNTSTGHVDVDDLRVITVPDKPDTSE